MDKLSEQILVKDACIIIDLIELNLLEIFLLLDYEVVTTLSVVSEITNEEQRIQIDSFIASKSIKIEAEGSLSDIMTLKSKYIGLSYADATVLELALRKKATLVTADRLLRKAGVNENNKVHGTLWIIKTMHYCRVISCKEAIEHINKLSNINKRICQDMCFTVIKSIEEEETTYHLNK